MEINLCELPRDMVDIIFYYLTQLIQMDNYKKYFLPIEKLPISLGLHSHFYSRSVTSLFPDGSEIPAKVASHLLRCPIDCLNNSQFLYWDFANQSTSVGFFQYKYNTEEIIVSVYQNPPFLSYSYLTNLTFRSNLKVVLKTIGYGNSNSME